MHSGTAIPTRRLRRRLREANVVVVSYKRAQHCCATLRRSQNNGNVGTWSTKSLTGFKLYTASGHNVLGPTMLRVVGQQCCIRLHGPLRFGIWVMSQSDPGLLLVVTNRSDPGLYLLVFWGCCVVQKGTRLKRITKESSLGGLEPPTFRLTAERANRLRHRDGHLMTEKEISGW